MDPFGNVNLGSLRHLCFSYSVKRFLCVLTIEVACQCHDGERLSTVNWDDNWM